MNKYTFRKFLLFSSMVIVVAIFLGGELAEYHKLDTIKDVTREIIFGQKY